jgi:hypothetical protein
MDVVPVAAPAPWQSGTDADLVTSIREAFARCQGFEHQLDVALEMIVSRANGKSGFLYLYETGKPTLVAQTTDALPPTNALQMIVEQIPKIDSDGNPIEYSEMLTESVADQDVQSSANAVLLSARVNGRELPVGAAVLLGVDADAVASLRELCAALALCIYENSPHNDAEVA